VSVPLGRRSSGAANRQPMRLAEVVFDLLDIVFGGHVLRISD